MQKKAACEVFDLEFNEIVINKTKDKKPFLANLDIKKDNKPNFNYNVAHDVRKLILIQKN